MSGWTTIWVLFAAILTGAVSWYTTPKGPNQLLIRTSVIMVLACCYMMWACAYLAQLHPLIQPKRGDVRFFD
ncbi:hypothetical protein MGL_2157 [Malassezia globosa CBS 7966]|uniref:V-type proton ATPase subunit n=1 Tax=Malassezia globosa (strain ATCC MYA-4612 / CBS 7966) TaxID=425265 RepID=A8Q272_MALGO|nr:uncharacterized protein MGL_2157 [Malassezia globosa CBS 7966]EDP43489.1 hypothetical protein MGL_2157 [Malassezia globosa CBS 7966]